MKKFLVMILSIFLFQIPVLAADPDLLVACPAGGAVDSTLKCTIKVQSDVTIKEISLEYDFGDSLTFVSYAPDTNFAVETNNSTGLHIKNENGVTGDFTIGTVSFKLNKAGNFALKEITMKDSEGATYTASRLSQPIKVLSEDNTLKSLKISPGTLTPEFSPSVTTYTAEVDAEKVTITGVANDANASYKSTSTQKLSYGENKIDYVVTSESGSKKTYKLIITRVDNRSTNNNLKNVTFSVGDFTFQPDNNSYTIQVDTSVTKVKVSAEVEDPKASFVSGYGPREISLLSEKTNFELRVKSENGVIKIYTFTFYKTDRELSTNNNIKTLVLEGYELDFRPTTLSYDIRVKSKTALNFQVELDDANAKYELVNSDLKNGNTVIIKVTAENGAVKEYKFNIIEEETKTATKTETKEKSKFMSEFLCSDNSILYYIIVFVIGLILGAIITSLAGKKKNKNSNNNSNSVKEVHQIPQQAPASDQTEKLEFGDLN